MGVKFVKGQSGNPNGKPKGATDKETKILRETINQFVEHNTDCFQKWVDQVEKKNPERAFEMVIKLMEFSIPKLKAIELSGPGGKDLNPLITIRLIDTADQIPPEIPET